MTERTSPRQMLTWILQPRQRRMVYAALVIILAILCYFPQPYLARAKILPQDNSSTGLNAVLNSIAGQDGVFSAFLSNRQAIDLYLVIGRSTEVQDDVIERLKLVGPSGEYSDEFEAKSDLKEKVEINSLTGGLIQIEVISHDKDEVEQIATVYAESISERIRSLGREQLSIKQDIVRDRFAEANKRVAESEVALDNFRRSTKLSANPEVELGVAISARASMEARIKAKQVEIRTLRRFAGPENIDLIAANQELTSLQSQLSSVARSTSSQNGGPTTKTLTVTSGKYLSLFRDYEYAQALYEVYSRFAEQIAVEELSSATVANVQIVESAHLEAERQYNLSALAILIALFLMIFFTEIYAPSTGLWSEDKKSKNS